MKVTALLSPVWTLLMGPLASKCLQSKFCVMLGPLACTDERHSPLCPHARHKSTVPLWVKPFFLWLCVCAFQQQQSARLADLHRKSQLWRGLVSIALIEGRNLVPMDANGLSDPYAKFRLGQQKYRSKVPLALTHTYSSAQEVFDWVCNISTDGAKDPESTVEGAVWPSPVRGERRSAGDHCVGPRHRQEGRLHGTVSCFVRVKGVKKFTSSMLLSLRVTC